MPDEEPLKSRVTIELAPEAAKRLKKNKAFEATEYGAAIAALQKVLDQVEIKVIPRAPKPKKLPKLLKGYRDNFNTMLRAANNGDLALVSAIRKSDNQPIALVCAMQAIDEGKSIMPVPFAVMIEGDPFELFHDPTA